MSEQTLKPGWKRWRFDQMAINVNDRIDNPAEADVQHYVGLEHLDTDSLKIHRWGAPTDVEATKLRFRKGDIIFGRRRAYQRKLAVAEFDGICSAHAMVLRPKTDVVLPEFLPFFMQSDLFMNRALEISVGSLSPTINWKTLAIQEFALPPLEEQGRIVHVLKALEEQLRTYEQCVSEAYKTTLSVAASLTTMRHMDERNWEHIPLPSGWKIQKIGQLCNLSGGFGFRPKDWSDKGLPIIRIQNLNGSADFNYFAGTPLQEWIVKPGELLFAWAGMPGVSFGPCLWPGPVGVLNQHIYRVSPIDGVSSVWLYYVLRLLTPWIERRAHGFKHTLLHIRREELTERLVPVPPSEVQQQIVDILQQCESSATKVASQLEKAKLLKHKLVNGKLISTPDTSKEA